jgi:SAM-dependent methyltransferase
MEAMHYEQAELWGEDQIFTPEHQLPKLQAITTLIGAPTAAVLDVGAGDGRLIAHLRSDGHTGPLFATDRSLTAIRHAIGPAAQSSGEALPVRDRGVDGAICSEVLEHLPASLLPGCVAELARVAASWIVITVPNQENRSRSEITCEACHCRYNPDRHLRSFTPESLAGLVPGFRVDQIIETGPRQPIYPRPVRLAMERYGLVVRPGSPTCPQCGDRYRFSAAVKGANTATAPNSGVDAGAGRRYGLVRKVLPKARHPYYLCARFRRDT